MTALLCILFSAAVSLLLGSTVTALIDYHFEAMRNRRLNDQNAFLKRQLEELKTNN